MTPFWWAQSIWDLLHVACQSASPSWSELVVSLPSLILMLVLLGLELYIPLYNLLRKLFCQLVAFSKFLSWTPISCLDEGLSLYWPLCITLLPMGTQLFKAAYIHYVGTQNTWLSPWLLCPFLWSLCLELTSCLKVRILSSFNNMNSQSSISANELMFPGCLE